jgi:Low-density lipoprotein receptor repeat class B
VAGSRHARRWTIALAASALGLLLLPGAAPAVDSVLWGNGGASRISSAALAGSGGVDLSFDAVPEGFAIDPAAGRIYWMDDTGGVASIRSASLDGGPVTTLDTGTIMGTPEGLAIDPAAKRLYWGDRVGQTISFVSIDPAHPGVATLPIGAAPINDPVGPAVDPTTGRIYWANNMGGTIAFANLKGSGGGQIPTGRATIQAPDSVAIDPSGGRIYWANGVMGGGSISFASLDPDKPGGGDVFTGYKATVNEPFGVALDPVAGRVYWANAMGQHHIAYTSLDDNGSDDNLNIAGTSASLPAPPDGARYPVLLVSPNAVAPPAIAGAGAVGSVLSCSQGSWAPDLVGASYYRAPQSFAFQWSRDGTDLPGATQTTLTAGTAGDYRCRVTATNHAGSTAQTSDAHHVSAPTGPPPPGPAAFGASTRVTLALVSARVGKRGPVQVRIANTNAFAIGATLTAQTSKPIAGAHGRRVSLATARFGLANGAKRTVKLSLPASLRALLAHRRAFALVLTAIVKDPAGHRRTVKATVTVKR